MAKTISKDEVAVPDFNSALAILDSANTVSIALSDSVTQNASASSWVVQVETEVTNKNNTNLDGIVTSMSNTKDSNTLTQLNAKYNQASQQSTQFTQQESNITNSLNSFTSNRTSTISGYNSAIQAVINGMSYTANLLT